LHSKQFIDKNKELPHAAKTSCRIYSLGLVFNFNRLSLNLNLPNAGPLLLAGLLGDIVLAGVNVGGGAPCNAAGGGITFFTLSAAFALALSAVFVFRLSVADFDFADVSNFVGLFRFSRSFAA